MTDGHLARLNISPRRIVAPVGREVIVQAGLCGADGYLLRSQPIEWSISPDSVGTIVEVDQTNKSVWRALLQKAPRKVSGSYALGLTSPFSQTVPRGTPDPADDIFLPAGQTWISVTSHSEGATQLTAVAPTTAGWEDRRDSATIYWVDGQWTLPLGITAGATGGVLQTRVARATSGLPLEGWRVRYEVSGGTPAAFDANGAQSIEVTTNADGNASATILPLGGYSGTTNVLVQVIRVGATAGDLPRLVVGQGTTTVTWVADSAASPDSSPPAVTESTPAPAPITVTPNISVRIDGPAVAELNGQITATVTVTNLGTRALEQAEVVNRVPQELEFLRASPQAGQFGDEVRWQLGGILPGDSRAIAIDYRVRAAGQVRNCVQATSGSVTADDCMTTVVSSAASAALSVQLRGPTDVRIAVGQRISYEIIVSNLGPRDLEGIVLEDQYDAGLEHQAGPAPLRWEIGTLPANSTRSFPIRFTVREPGAQCHEVTVRAADGSQASGRACITATPAGSATPSSPPASALQRGPEIQLRVQGPQRSRQGLQEVFELEVENVGDVPLTDVQVQATLDAELAAKETAPEARRTGDNGALWTLPRLAIGERQQLRVRCDVNTGRTRACLQAEVGTTEGARASQEWCVEIEQPSTSPAPDGLRGSEQSDLWSPQQPGVRPQLENRAASSDLTLQIARQESPFSAERGNLLYRITLSNPGQNPHTEVTLRVAVPENSTYVSSQGPPAVDVLEVSADRSQLMFRPIATLRPNETVTFQVEVRPLAAIIGKMSAEATSVENRSGVSAMEP